MMVSLSGSPIYQTVPSPTTPGQQSYPGGITNWSRGSFIPSPRWQGPSSYAPLILPQGMVSVPGWNAYSGQLTSASSSENLQQTNVNNQIYGASHQNESGTSGSQASFSQLRSGSVPVGIYALQRENVFPERPGQPECQFYMKTGDCKFGAVCRFHHPRERVLPAPDCVLSPIGLPLRSVSNVFSAQANDSFMLKNGCCFGTPSGNWFGPSCKFNHPMGIFTDDYSASSLSDVPVRNFLGSSAGTTGLKLSPEGLVEAVSTKPRRLSLSENRQLSPSDDNIDTEG
ncbi:Zinc finger CCCH domain-containing protein ZFN-like [Hibiscus syriacus]|uniref:Zinc finger CCCH domain-containing protein ZFN-like n=1 Tax=Hibiscus syriacus TaxID=106335 RepID=A0A6A2XPA1_HIBSY|nr:Zinc finger CCCH domain-containing protein ZFN-like [Hibiscus syriacus]